MRCSEKSSSVMGLNTRVENGDVQGREKGLPRNLQSWALNVLKFSYSEDLCTFHKAVIHIFYPFYISYRLVGNRFRAENSLLRSASFIWKTRWI